MTEQLDLGLAEDLDVDREALVDDAEPVTIAAGCRCAGPIPDRATGDCCKCGRKLERHDDEDDGERTAA